MTRALDALPGRLAWQDAGLGWLARAPVRISRWLAAYRESAEDEKWKRDLDRLDEFHLDDIGVKRIRRATWFTTGHFAPEVRETVTEYHCK